MKMDPRQVLGVVDRTPIGVDEALQLSDWVLDVIAQGGSDPILILGDSDSQRNGQNNARRDGSKFEHGENRCSAGTRSPEGPR